MVPENYEEKFIEYKRMKRENGEDFAQEYLEQHPILKQIIELREMKSSKEKVQSLEQLSNAFPEDKLILFEYMKAYIEFYPGITNEKLKREKLTQLLGTSRNSFALFQLATLDIESKDYEMAKERLLQLHSTGKRDDLDMSELKLGEIEYNVMQDYEKAKEYFQLLHERNRKKNYAFANIAELYMNLCKIKNNENDKQRDKDTQYHAYQRLRKWDQFDGILAEDTFTLWVNAKMVQENVAFKPREKYIIKEILAHQMRKQNYSSVKRIAEITYQLTSDIDILGILSEAEKQLGEKENAEEHFEKWLTERQSALENKHRL